MPESSPQDSPHTYGVLVGTLWVAIDFQAKAVAITRTGDQPRQVETEDLGHGFLVDRDSAGRVCSVECLG